jgi:hypothetical protein
MESMVERVARAIECRMTEWLDHEIDTLDVARDVLEAIREPTQDQQIAAIEAGLAAHSKALQGLKDKSFSDWASAHVVLGSGKTYVAGWTAMIDAALKE